MLEPGDLGRRERRTLPIWRVRIRVRAQNSSVSKRWKAALELVPATTVPWFSMITASTRSSKLRAMLRPSASLPGTS